MSKYVVANDFLDKDGGNLSDQIQRIIDDNPNRTIFFSDGEYLIDKPILTSANPKKSVSLKLADFAVFKAVANWPFDEAMIRLGGKEPSNEIFTVGSNYGLNGGIIDGSGVAKGISIDSGRETYIRNMSIKNALCGIHIKQDANYGSSDSDISGVNITGNAERDSIGLLVEGYDNTFTNMRIANVFIGVDVRSGGNIFRNIHPLYYTPKWTWCPTYSDFEESIGFKISKSNDNWFDFCYSDQFATGFKTLSGGGNYVNCFCFWYSEEERKHIAFESEKPFCGRINGFTVGGKKHNESGNKFSENLVLTKNAVINGVMVDGKLIDIES